MTLRNKGTGADTVLNFKKGLSQFQFTLSASASSSSFRATMTIDNSNYAVQEVKVVSRSKGSAQINGSTYNTVGTIVNVSSSTTVTLVSAGSSTNGSPAAVTFMLNP